MNKEEMKAVLVKDLEFWSDQLIEEQRQGHDYMVNEIRSVQSTIISFSVNLKIITFEEAEELQQAYDLL